MAVSTFYMRLKLVVDKQTHLPSIGEIANYYQNYAKQWSYKLIVKTKGKAMLNGKKEKTYDGKFTLLCSQEQTFTADGYSLAEINSSFDVTWEISFNGKKRYSCKGKFFDHSIASGKRPRDGGGVADWTTHSIDLTKTIKEFKDGQVHLVTQQITSGTGWYLVKKPEAFGDLVNRIYIKPTNVEWDIMVSNNPHLKNAGSRATMLQVGQVVIIAKTKSEKNAKLQRMKQEATQAQKAFEQAQVNGGVDATFLMLLDLALQGHKLTKLDDKAFSNGAVGAGVISAIELGKPFLDGTLEFSKSMFEQTVKAHEKIIKAAAGELNKVSTVGGMTKRGTSAAGQNASKAYKLMNGSELARKLFSWETGIQGNSVRDYIHNEARVRSANYQKGVQGLASEIEGVSHSVKWLKKAGYLGIAVEVGVSGYKINEAYERGDTKGVIEESGQLGGSLGGGLAGGAVGGYVGAGAVVALAVFGIATGGVGLVIVGLFVAGGAYLGGEIGKGGAKIVTDWINE